MDWLSPLKTVFNWDVFDFFCVERITQEFAESLHDSGESLGMNAEMHGKTVFAWQLHVLRIGLIWILIPCGPTCHCYVFATRENDQDLIAKIAAASEHDDDDDQVESWWVELGEGNRHPRRDVYDEGKRRRDFCREKMG